MSVDFVFLPRRPVILFAGCVVQCFCTFFPCLYSDLMKAFGLLDLFEVILNYVWVS